MCRSRRRCRSHHLQVLLHRQVARLAPIPRKQSHLRQQAPLCTITLIGQRARGAHSRHTRNSISCGAGDCNARSLASPKRLKPRRKRSPVVRLSGQNPPWLCCHSHDMRTFLRTYLDSQADLRVRSRAGVWVCALLACHYCGHTGSGRKSARQNKA